MNIEWNKVTWYSKTAAIVLFVCTFFLGFWLGEMNTEKVYVVVPRVIERDSNTTMLPTERVNGLIEIGMGETGSTGGMTITAQEVVEDSRCPSDVQCIQAGNIRVRAILKTGVASLERVFLLGEPVVTDTHAVTLVEVKPVKVSTVKLNEKDYRFVFKVLPQTITYRNVSPQDIEVEMPSVGAVVGTNFVIKGVVRSDWYDKGYFPVRILDADGKVVASMRAHETTGVRDSSSRVPFSSEVTIQTSYVGGATVVLEGAPSSGGSGEGRSISFPVTVAY